MTSNWAQELKQTDGLTKTDAFTMIDGRLLGLEGPLTFSRKAEMPIAYDKPVL